MKCKVISATVAETNGRFRVICELDASQVDTSLPLFNPDGTINVNRAMVRNLSFTKSLFPGDEVTCNEIAEAIIAQQFMYAELVTSKAMPAHYLRASNNTKRAVCEYNGVFVYAEQQGEVEVTQTVNGRPTKVKVPNMVPRVFTTMSQAFLCDTNGKQTEYPDIDTEFERRFNEGVGTQYFPIEGGQ
jgi:Tfp pilus assembly protein PilW